MKLHHRRGRGSVFVLTLAVLAGVVAVVVSIAATQHLAFKAQSNRSAARRAKLAADSALQRALASLAQTVGAGQSAGGTGATSAPTGRTSSTTAVTLQDDWATLGNNGDERFVVGTVSYRIQILDSSSRLNLNTASQAELQKLPLTAEQIDCLLDWREAGQTPRSQGAKDSYYNGLQNPYNTALRRLNTLDELLLVKGFTPADVYDVPSNQSSTANLPDLADGRTPTIAELATTYSYVPQTQSNGQARVNVNQPNLTAPTLARAGFTNGDATLIVTFMNAQQGRPVGSLAPLLALPNLSPTAVRAILDGLTIANGNRAEGRVNLNTASTAVLETLPGVTADVAQAIVQRQTQGFTKLSDILSVPGLTNGPVLRQVIDSFSVSSSTFIVRLIGEAGPTQVAREATIDVQSGTPEVLTVHDESFPDMPTRWGWQPNPSQNTVIKGAQ